MTSNPQIRAYFQVCMATTACVEFRSLYKGYMSKRIDHIQEEQSADFLILTSLGAVQTLDVCLHSFADVTFAIC